MRKSLLEGLFRNAVYNINRKIQTSNFSRLGKNLSQIQNQAEVVS